MRFDEAVSLFPDEYFDFIYVDGYAHTGEEGGRTLVQWLPKLRREGVLAGHDYDQMFPQVLNAVDDFLEHNGLPLFVVADHSGGWNHGCSSWFTVRPCIEAAGTVDPPKAVGDALTQATALYREGRFAAARAKLVTQTPTWVSRRLEGQCLHAEGRPAEALSYLTQVLEEKPSDPISLLAGSSAALAIGENEFALELCDRLLVVRPGLLPARRNRGRALVALFRHGEAISDLEAVLQSVPNDDSVVLLLARALLHTRGGSERAGELANSCLERAPESAAAHQILGEALLQQSNFAHGWDHYVYRRQIRAHVKSARPFRYDVWAGQDLNGTLLVTPDVDQGIGVEVLCATMYPDLLARGLNVIVESSQRVAPILRRSFPEFDIRPLCNPPMIAARDPKIEALANFSELARVLRRDASSFGYGRILQPLGAVKKARRRPQVGVSWRSVNSLSGASRSIPLPELMAVLIDVDVDVVALQYGDISDDLAASQQMLGKAPARPSANFLLDLASFVEAVNVVDLVISIDNSTVHFAGALGRRCWALLPPASHWHWGCRGSRNPWFSSVALLRAEEDDWSPLLDCLRARILEWRQDWKGDSSVGRLSDDMASRPVK